MYTVCPPSQNRTEQGGAFSLWRPYSLLVLVYWTEPYALELVLCNSRMSRRITGTVVEWVGVGKEIKADWMFLLHILRLLLLWRVEYGSNRIRCTCCSLFVCCRNYKSTYSGNMLTWCLCGRAELEYTDGAVLWNMESLTSCHRMDNT